MRSVPLYRYKEERMKTPAESLPAHAIPGELRGRAKWGLACAVVACTAVTPAYTQAPFSFGTPADTLNESGTNDLALIDDLQTSALRFFIEHTDISTGLTRDRAPADGSTSKAPASIAATGFALTAWCIAEHRGWMGREETIERARKTLRFVHDHVANEHGWVYHFLDINDGARVWKCEASTIDTALFLKGALMAREYLRDPEVTALVNDIYARIDWRWAMNGGATLTHGWRPESGFLPSRWDSYSEMLGLYLLGIGAPKNPLPADAWKAWSRPTITYGNRTFIHCPPLFTHQYAHAWFDFRGRRDDFADYWQNSVDATLAQREWCATLAHTFTSWSHDLWGITASDSAKGYIDWGGPQGGASDKLDGTLVPCAPAGSLPFAPEECLAALKAMRAAGGDRVWGRYGFADAFNPETGWVASDVIAIDVGITLLMSENLRSGFVWRYFMHAPEARRGLAMAGFRDNNLPGFPDAGRVAMVEK